MLSSTILHGSSLAALLPIGATAALHNRFLQQVVQSFHQSSSAVLSGVPSSSLGIMLDTTLRREAAAAQEGQGETPPGQRVLLLHYTSTFPDPLYTHLAGLVAGRPFPTAVDMSCAAPGVAGAELGRRGFRVAVKTCCGASAGSHSCSCACAGNAPSPSSTDGLPTWSPRLPGGCSDVVAVLPGPRDLHQHANSSAPSVLLAEARRLMADGGYLALAWNDRDLSSPFMCELEQLLESVNPSYCRSSRQHNPPAVLAALSHALARGDASSSGVVHGAAAGGSSVGGGSGGSSPSAGSPPLPLELDSFSSWAHGLSMACAGVLQDLVGGFEVVRPYLAASSTHRKAFHQALRALVRRHFGADDAPFELPLVTKLYVLRHAAAQPSAAALTASSSAAHTASGDGTHTSSSSSPGAGDTSAAPEHSSSSADSSSSSSVPAEACVCQQPDGDGFCMTHHVRTRRAGLSSRDSCSLRHLYT